MFKKFPFAAVYVFWLSVFALVVPAWAQTPAVFVDAIQQEMQDGSMDKWRGAMPLETPADPDAYVKQFTKWAAIIENGNSMGLSGGDLAAFNDYKTRVADIQAEAFPKVRANYYQIYKPFFENYGLTPEHLKIEIYGPGNSQMKITSEAFADPDFLLEFYQGIWPGWPYCRFQHVELHMVTPGETVHIRTFDNNPAISDRSILLYKSRKDYRIIE